MSLIKDGNVGGKTEPMGPEGATPKLNAEALLALEPFSEVFGSKKTRKRARISAANLATLASQVSTAGNTKPSPCYANSVLSSTKP